MLIERNAFDETRTISVEALREKCVGCTDCKGPCMMLLELSALPDIVLGREETHP